MTAIDDLLDKLDAPRDIIESENWIHKAAGDIVAGKILGFGDNTTDYGTYHIVTVEPAVAIVDGAQMVLPEGVNAVAIHMMGTVRQNFWDKTPMVVGGDFACRFDGKVPSKTAGRGDYDNFACGYEPPSAVGNLPPAPAATGGVLG